MGTYHGAYSGEGVVRPFANQGMCIFFILSFQVFVVTLHVLLPYGNYSISSRKRHGATVRPKPNRNITKPNDMLNIILCGAPGSGKGTQSAVIVEKYGLEHLSTGDLLRKEIASGSAFGKKIDAIISKGNLVPDDVMLRLIEHYMDALPADCKGVIFDGFPRTLNQAIEFGKILAHRRTSAILVDLKVDDAELLQRLVNRGKTSGRSDDNPETIRKRLAVYHHQTEAVSGYYRDLGLYYPVDGTGAIQEIFERIADILDNLNGR